MDLTTQELNLILQLLNAANINGSLIEVVYDLKQKIKKALPEENKDQKEKKKLAEQLTPVEMGETFKRLNTSFNNRGEPLVCTPKDAIRTFFSSNLKYLAMGDFLIEKS